MEVMVDLETMSSSSNAAIVSIGACEFSLAEERLLKALFKGDGA